jgi:hypothetical protein
MGGSSLKVGELAVEFRGRSSERFAWHQHQLSVCRQTCGMQQLHADIRYRASDEVSRYVMPFILALQDLKLDRREKLPATSLFDDACCGSALHLFRQRLAPYAPHYLLTLQARLHVFFQARARRRRRARGLLPSRTSWSLLQCVGIADNTSMALSQ